MVTIEDVSQLCLGISQAVLEPAKWTAAIGAIGHRLDASGAALIGPDQQGGRRPQYVTLPREAAASYAAYYHRFDVVLDAVESGPVGRVRSGAEVIDPFAGCEFDLDWMRPNDVHDGLFVRLTPDSRPTTFLIAAPMRLHAFDTPQRRRVLETLVPHLQQALRAQIVVGELSGQHRDLEHAVDTWNRCVIVVGAGGVVLQANSAAMTLLRSDDGLAVRSDVIRATRPLSDAQLGRCIAEAVGDPVIVRGNTVKCPRPSGKSDYIVHVVPGAGAGAGDEHGPRRALVIVTDPSSRRAPQEMLLYRMFGMTTAEAAIAIRMLDGGSLQSIADAACVSLATVKTHVQKIYAKTGTSRHAELVSQLLRLSM